MFLIQIFPPWLAPIAISPPTLRWTPPGALVVLVSRTHRGAVSSTRTPQAGTWLQRSESPGNTARDFSSAGLSQQAKLAQDLGLGEQRVSSVALGHQGCQASLCPFLP